MIMSELLRRLKNFKKRECKIYLLHKIYMELTEPKSKSNGGSKQFFGRLWFWCTVVTYALNQFLTFLLESRRKKYAIFAFVSVVVAAAVDTQMSYEYT